MGRDDILEKHFEFILELKESSLKQISGHDFRALFDYFILRRRDYQLMVDYLGKFNYDFISKYLKSRE